MKKIIIILLALVNIFLIITVVNINKERRQFNTFVNSLIQKELSDNEILKIKELHSLTEYCYTHNNNDSIIKFINVNKMYFGNSNDGLRTLYHNIAKSNKKDYLRFIELLSIYNIKNNNHYYSFDMICPIVIAQKDTIQLGDMYNCNIFTAVNDFYMPIQIKFTEDDSVYTIPDNFVFKYSEKALTKGEKKLSGRIIVNRNGNGDYYEFEKHYFVK
ncbi:MAG: hypothetical protein IJV31_06675 [Clostridia bacterium]|nr:hypothetical protein [Clostridia bacterium]